jgi:uncharacterized surface protein with fasciclin (FAS1) repeats
MKITKRIFLFNFISLIIIACKNETSEKPPTNPESETLVEEKMPAKTIKDSLYEKRLNSVVSKMMFAEESKSFVRFLISADMIDHLSYDEGPFTILAPSNTAFDELKEEQLSKLQNYREKEYLSGVLKSHIVSGELDTAAMVQEIKKNRGKLKLKTLSGKELILSRKGSDIIVTDENGTKARIGKSDIKGSNGVIHILDAVIGLN